MGQIYHFLSVESAFCTCAPTNSFSKHELTGQYAGMPCPLKFFQWFNQLPHTHVVSDVPFMFVIFAISLEF